LEQEKSTETLKEFLSAVSFKEIFLKTLNASSVHALTQIAMIIIPIANTFEQFIFENI